MSTSNVGKSVEKPQSSIPGILADFFLKKIEMDSHSEDSESKYSVKKRSKHKKSKHKRSSSSDRDSHSGYKKFEDSSGSEGKSWRRLKTLKDEVSNIALPPTNSGPLNEMNNSSKNSSENLEYYGPSLELLLSGVDSHSSQKTSNETCNVVTSVKKENCFSLASVNSANDGHSDKKIESAVSNEIVTAIQEELIKELESKDKEESVSNEIVSAIQEDLIKKLESKGDDKKKDERKSVIKLEHVVDDKIAEAARSSTISMDKEKHFIKLEKAAASDMKGEENLNKSIKVESSDNKIKFEKETNEMPKDKVVLDKDTIKHERRKSRSRSGSKTKSTSFKKISSKSQFRKRESSSRSSSRESHSRHSRRYSRSSSKEKSKKHSYKKHSRSRSRSKLHNLKRSRHSRSQSRSPKRKVRSRSRSRLQYRRKSRSISRNRSPKFRIRPSVKSRRRSRSRSEGRYRKRSHSKSRSRSLSRSKTKRQSRSRSRSKTKRHCRSRSRSKNRRRSRSRSKSRNRKRSRSASKTRTRRHSRSRSKSVPRKKTKDRVSHSRSNSKEGDSKKVYQAKVLETARKNVLKMMKDGTLPEGLDVENLKKEHILSIQAGGKSVQELTDFCQRLSRKENDADDSNSSREEEKADDNGFIHHPFKVKESTMIRLNIKNAVQLPIKTRTQKIEELSSQFPVSSGNQHKRKELEWVPVVPDESSKTEKVVPPELPTSAETTVALIENPPLPPSSPPPQPPPTLETPVSYPSVQLPEVPAPALPPLLPPPMPPQFIMAQQPLSSVPTTMPPALLPTPPPPPQQSEMVHYMMPQVMVQNVCEPPPMPQPQPQPSNSVFKPRRKIDISSIVTKRFQALTKLKQNENDPEALSTLQQAQQDIQEWVESQQVPGQFTGSTDAKFLTYNELCGPIKYYKFKKDFLLNAPPVSGGKGMSLLKKMGWKPGEGLGKNREGSLVPLVLDIKTDKKGIVAEGENSKKGVVSSFTKELQGKHPVSALMELCSKRKWKAPFYTCTLDTGPSHKKQYCFKVEVNGVEYQPLGPVANKKVAKADAAIICLQALNVFPKTPS